MNLKIQELSFSLFAKELSPGTIHPAILQYLGIIPVQWELIESPIYSDREVKLVFTNQVSLMIQPNRIIFAETIEHKRLNEVQVPNIVTTYSRIFSNINYQEISISPSGYVAFNSDIEASQYMKQNLLPSSPWKTFGNRSMNTMGLKLAYPYESGNFYLDINQANVEVLNQVIPAVWFVGNFNYQLTDDHNAQKLVTLQSLIQQWKTDVTKFGNFIGKKFLASSKVPAVISNQ
ncbi:MAG TPA: hypothetical protein ACFCUY_14580 [Xenococcaceae cyanobacterium]